MVQAAASGGSSCRERVARADRSCAIPFDAAKLDRLMEAAGLDVLVATSKHNVQYLLGAERAIFFDYMDALGVSRYLPVLVYPKGAPEKAVYIGHRLETHQRAVAPPWVPQVRTEFNGSVDAITRAVEPDPGRRRAAEARRGRDGVPADGCGRALDDALPGGELKDALLVLERLRAVKSAAELAKLKTGVGARDRLHAGGDRQARPGHDQAAIVGCVAIAEANRGLTFEYCLLACGNSHNRAPSAQRWEQGDVLSLDSGGNYHGYIGDLARMAVLGEPDAELKDLLAEIEAVQRAAFAAVRPGAMGGDIYVAAERRARADQPARLHRFFAHGMGLVSHEAPRLTAKGPSPTTIPTPACRWKQAWSCRSRPR